MNAVHLSCGLEGAGTENIIWRCEYELHLHSHRKGVKGMSMGTATV